MSKAKKCLTARNIFTSFFIQKKKFNKTREEIKDVNCYKGQNPRQCFSENQNWIFGQWMKMNRIRKALLYLINFCFSATNLVAYNPIVYDLPVGLWMGTATGFVIHHSYQTCLALLILQKCNSNSSPWDNLIGVHNGKKMGNQLNIPLEWVSGLILIITSLYKVHSK